MCNIAIMRKFAIILLALSLVCCSSLTPWKKKTTETPKKTERADKIDEKAPQPGDVQTIDGVEYIYARNKRYQLTPYEPEYLWIRKDQYSPGILESLTGGGQGKKEREQLEGRIARLEDDLKKKGVAPQMVYPHQLGYLPGMGYYPPSAPIGFSYPSPKMKRRVVVLPMEDQTNYKSEHLDELTTARIVSRIENAGAIICVDPATITHTGKLTDPQNMKMLNELYGIQALITGSLSDLYTSMSKVEGKDDREASFAFAKITLSVYNTETGRLLRQLSGRNPVFLSRERGDMSTEKAKLKAIDLSIELVADDLLKAVLSLDWHGRIASIEKDRVFVNAGRLSGLERGDTLEVYGPGEQVIDATTKAPLGKTKGSYKGELEVSELFGVDACWARVKTGDGFSPTDFVYYKK
jgi:hypothetical protein